MNAFMDFYLQRVRLVEVLFVLFSAGEGRGSSGQTGMEAAGRRDAQREGVGYSELRAED